MPYPVSSVRNRNRNRQFLYDDFSGTLGSWWTTVLGTLETSSGALQAATVAGDAYNIVSNPEFTSALTGWGAANGAAQARVDSATDPGSSSGGADSWCDKLTDSTAAGFPLVQMPIGGIAGATYTLAGRVYVPSTNTQAANAAIGIADSTLRVVSTTEDAWTAVSITGYAAAAAALRLWLRYGDSTAGDVAYWDAISCIIQSAILTGNIYNPNALVVVSVISPAALVTPRAITLRVVDELNYVRLLVLPNTAGNDCILQTVTAGVIANVADGVADVDWTAGGADQVQVFVQGNTYTVQHMKSGASVWTTAFAATTASFNTSTVFGVQLFAATDPSFSAFKVESL